MVDREADRDLDRVDVVVGRDSGKGLGKVGVVRGMDTDRGCNKACIYKGSYKDMCMLQDSSMIGEPDYRIGG